MSSIKKQPRPISSNEARPGKTFRLEGAIVEILEKPADGMVLVKKPNGKKVSAKIGSLLTV